MVESKSTSLVSGRIYTIPEGSDQYALQKFIQNLQGKKIVAIQGFGFVGIIMYLVVANFVIRELRFC